MMKERLAVTKRVMKAMRHESARKPLVDRDSAEPLQLVVCLPSDTIEYAARRVQAVGGHATVVVPHRNVLVPLVWTLQPVPAQRDCTADDGPIHPESTVGMLAEYLQEAGLEKCTYRISDEIGAVDVSEGDELTVPA